MSKLVIPSQPEIHLDNKEDQLALPQWTIAAIVIGLASLLFIIIFGATVVSVSNIIKTDHGVNLLFATSARKQREKLKEKGGHAAESGHVK